MQLEACSIMLECSFIDFDQQNGQKLKINKLDPRGGLDSVAKLAPSGAETCISYGAKLKLGIQPIGLPRN